MKKFFVVLVGYSSEMEEPIYEVFSEEERDAADEWHRQVIFRLLEDSHGRHIQLRFLEINLEERKRTPEEAVAALDLHYDCVVHGVCDICPGKDNGPFRGRDEDDESSPE